jgi:predicted AAA+ superfamily ATPase
MYIDRVSDYLPRLADRRLHQLVDRFAAISIVGPRACGKTTTARRIAQDTVRLDRPADAAGFRADPDTALAAVRTPVLLDEWQEVPEVLGAVKRAVDDARGVGRFILTGSVRAELDAATWPGTGRLVRLPMSTLCERELSRRTEGRLFLDHLADTGVDEITSPDAWNLRDYLEAATRGGFPEPALSLDADGRQDWLESYLDQLVTRDAPTLGTARDPDRLRRYLEVEALSTAGQPTDTTMAAAAGVDRRTAAAYQQLLSNLLVLDVVPAWTSNRLTRLARTPKRYLSDPSLVAGALRLDATGVLRDGDMLGRLLDTFVAAQVRAELPMATSRPRLYHAREQGGAHEVDLVVEFGGRRVAGIEVKATAAPRRSDAVHLEWMRKNVGDRFVAGVVLHTGSARIRFDETLWALPISSLWA